MENITAGETLTASVLNNWAPVAQTSTPTVATNFSLSNFSCYKIAGVTWFAVALTYSGSTLTGGSGGTITATQCCTLPFAPQATMPVAYQSASTYSGVINIDPAGVCKLITLAASATIASGNIVTFSGVILTG